MTLPRFLQIHTLHNYPAALLNRDDAGLAKRLPYADKVRTRISSQCRKRHWRVADDAFALSRLDVPRAVRSRETPRLTRDRLVAAGVAEPLVQLAVEGLRAAGLVDGLYDGDAVIDVPQLVANLEGVHIKDRDKAMPEQRALAGRVVQNMLHLIAIVSPGAKRGSTAPFGWARFMLVEAGDGQPRSLAGAFRNAVPQNQPPLRKVTVDNAPLRDGVAHRRSLRPHVLRPIEN